MYKVLKEKGNNSNVIVENTETKAQVVVGRMTMDILATLEKESYTFDNLREAWDLTVSESTAKELTSKAMRMSRPIRSQAKTSEQKKEENKTIDAMDVMLGLARYKK